MDVTAVLAGIASGLSALPESLVEQQLVTFDVLVGVGDEGTRPAAAAMLSAAASSAADPERCARLKKASAAVALGQPCAFTPDGLSAQQAAASQTVTAEEWERRIAVTPLPPPPAPDDPAEVGEEEEDQQAEPPPLLPQLPVRRFFPGIVVRVAQPFTDRQGRAFLPGQLLTLLKLEPDAEGVRMILYSGSVSLADGDAMANAGNAWFQPVPSPACLEALLEAIELELDHIEDEAAAVLREYVNVCQRWLASEGPMPEWVSDRAVGRLLRRELRLGAWFRWLAAALPAMRRS